MGLKRGLSPETLDLMSAGTMIPACILVAWLLYLWMHHNGWVGEKAEFWFILFGVVTGLYNFLRIVARHGSRKQ
jgi:hypothetical protein